MLELRPAAPDDSALLLRLIRDLAEYERLSERVVATEESLVHSLFGNHPKAHALIAEWSGKPVGFALYFYNYSTFLGRSGIYLEDVYVDPAYRGKGIGKAVFQKLAAIAVAENCGRLEWSVLDWNEPAIAFYQAMGAEALTEWTVNRLEGDALKAVAEHNSMKDVA